MELRDNFNEDTRVKFPAKIHFLRLGSIKNENIYDEIIKISKIIRDILLYKRYLNDAVDSFRDINNYLFKLFLEGQTFFK